MRKLTSVLLAGVVMASMVLTGCSGGKEKVIIYTSAEDYRVEYLMDRLSEEFPDYNCIVEYKDTGSHAATLIAEGKDTACDITYDLEYGYLSQLEDKGVLADLSEFDSSVYTDDSIVSSYYLPTYRNGGAIIINPQVLADKNLAVPASYDDLLKPEYKGYISMPSPKSSGTGYMFVKALVNAMGEEQAFKYFEKLDENILAYTSSGSGPVNALKNQEVAIGLGMTAQSIQVINEGTDLDIIFFEQGSPYTMYGQAMISGKEERTAVKEVFEFISGEFTKENNEKFCPEQIYKTGVPEMENYPAGIVYADMSGNTPEEKIRLLEKWMY